MPKREVLSAAVRALLWEQGFEAMRPSKLMRMSGPGQGSLYHHFAGKDEMAITDLSEVAELLCRQADNIFDPEKPPMDRFYEYLMLPRPELKGCQMGRLISDKRSLNQVFSPLFSSILTMGIACCCKP